MSCYMYFGSVGSVPSDYMYNIILTLTVADATGFTCLITPLKKYTDVDFPSGLMIFLVPLGNRITRLPSS